MTEPICNCKAEHWQWHAKDCPRAAQRTKMTPTTPSPISDRAGAAIGEPIDMALLAEQQAAFDKWWPQWRHLCPDRCGAAVAFVAGMDAERSTAPTTGSAPADTFAEYRRGAREAFDLANMIKANPQGRNAEETSAYIVRSLAELANGGREPAAPASPAASALSDDVILSFAPPIMTTLLIDFEIVNFARALLAASMGGNKS